MSKIYLPAEYLNKPCYVINNGYIRAYETINARDNVVYDIYVNQDYMVKQSTASYSDYTVCDTSNTYTSNILYRVDFMNILVCIIILLFFSIGIPFKLLTRFFRRFR